MDLDGGLGRIPRAAGNLRVDVLVVTAPRRALRVSQGPFVEGRAPRPSSWCEGDEAVRRRCASVSPATTIYEVDDGLRPATK